MKKLFSLIFFSLVTLVVTAQTFTPTSTGDMTQNGVTVSFAANGGNPPAWYDNGLRLYANNTITVSGSALTTVKLVFTKQGSKPYATLAANTGTLVGGGESSSADDPKADIWTGSATSVVFTLGTSGQRLVKQIIVNGDTTQIGGGGSIGGGTNGDSTTLNPSYQYAEPTIVRAGSLTAATGNNMKYSFVENNILVSCAMGAIVRESTTSSDYFGCNAGQTITFTATKPIKGLTVNGYIKKDFEATASSGELYYADASEAEVEANPVLIMTDINNTSVTLNCVKQIRFYSIEFYFEENPDVELGGDGDGEYSYEWEPTDSTTFNLTFDTLEVSDMTEYLGYKAVYLSLLSEDAELDMVAFADYDERTGIAVGTYPLNFSYEEGTVEASPGGDDYYDYESYLMTNFQEIEGEWYYDPYYLVSGTLTVTNTEMSLNAKSYYGSTVVATYTFPATALEQVAETDKAVKAVKALENGCLVIRRDGKRYNVLGARL